MNDDDTKIHHREKRPVAPAEPKIHNLVCTWCHQEYRGDCEGHRYYGSNCCDDHYCSPGCFEKSGAF